MSEIAALELAGAAHWAHSAFVLARRLKRVIAAGSLYQGDIPKGVENDGRRFFDLVIQLIDNKAQNIEASNTAYRVAQTALTTAAASEHASDHVATLREFSAFVSTLSTPRQLSTDEKKLAQSLENFLMRIHCRGVAEDYLNVVDDWQPAIRAPR